MSNETMIKVFQNDYEANGRLTYDILDGMVDWVRVVDVNGIVIYVNKSMKESLGRNLIGNSCYKSVGKLCPCTRCITKTTIATGMPAEKEEIVGDKIYSVKSSPVREKNGDIYASVEVFRDVTKERKLEKEIKTKNKKMNDDLVFARTLQQKILPKKGNYGSLKVDYIYKPSELLSGDMFDVFKINENLTGIYISDVVGHGVTASMMTMFIRQTMRAIKNDYLCPSDTLTELHKRFYELGLDDDKYFTIFYGIIDNRKGLLTYANGGHNSIPILITKEKNTLLEISGFPITNLFEAIEFEEESIRISKGDKLFLYTDGVIEARNKNGEEFGLERLLKIFKENIKHLEAIDEKLSKFKYDLLDDDIAIVKTEII